MGMTVFSGMLIATILGVCLIPMLFVAIEKVIGGSKQHTPAATASSGTLAAAAQHGHGSH
jgi:HAE1 family hydrophobic/amphiphilic exporter-1